MRGRMTFQLGPEHFVRPDAAPMARVVDGLPDAIDEAADAAAGPYRFLRRHWFATAAAAYGGVPRTVVVEARGRAVSAMPLVAVGPVPLGLAQLPGSYWPMRSAPLAADIDDAALARLGEALAGNARAVRIGPIMDDDPLVTRLLPVLRGQGWATIDRELGHSFRLDVAAQTQPWPRTSTAKKTRYFAKQLAAGGDVQFTEIRGSAWTADAALQLARIETASWVTTRAGGADAKFAASGHAAFWTGVTTDAALADMLVATILSVGDAPVAFVLDLDSGGRRYTIANSYDPAFAAASPGRVLGWHALTKAGAEGTIEIDWGSGDSGYKSGFGANEGPALRDWLLFAPGVPAWAGRVAARLRR